VLYPLSYEGERIRVSGNDSFVVPGLIRDDKAAAVWYSPAETLGGGSELEARKPH
jgi:hypothetical protein